MMTRTHSTGRNLLEIVAFTVAGVALASPSLAWSQAPPAQQIAQGAQSGDKQKNDEAPLALTLTTNIRKIRGDKGDKGPWRDATLSYGGSDGKPVVVPIKIKTRGIWRKKNCEFPPVRLNIARETSKGTAFYGLDKPKLVSYCRDDDTYEQWVIQEFQLYRIYNMFTPMSYKARLVEMTYSDEAGKVQAKRAAIILEQPELLPERMELSPVKEKGA